MEEQMGENEYLRAVFFASDAEMADAKLKADALIEARRQRRRDRAKQTAGIRALGRFAKSLQQLDEAERRANILWLADSFLGIKLWRW